MSAIDELLDHHDGDHHNWNSMTDFTLQARAELAALRARVAELENDIICAFCGTHYHADAVPPNHWRTCEESPLVQAVNEAREAMIDMHPKCFGSCFDPINPCLIGQWLAAHPAPEPQP